MKVYALFSGEYSDTTLWGVFTTRERAQARIDDAARELEGHEESRARGYGAAAFMAESPRIEEHDTDLTWEELQQARWAKH